MRSDEKWAERPREVARRVRDRASAHAACGPCPWRRSDRAKKFVIAISIAWRQSGNCRRRRGRRRVISRSRRDLGRASARRQPIRGRGSGAQTMVRGMGIPLGHRPPVPARRRWEDGRRKTGCGRPTATSGTAGARRPSPGRVGILVRLRGAHADRLTAAPQRDLVGATSFGRPPPLGATPNDPTRCGPACAPRSGTTPTATATIAGA